MKSIMVYGIIGMDVLAGDFITQLAAIKGKVTLRINSLGGDVFAGLAISNAIAARAGDITAQIDGVAASAATMIALAAGRVTIADNAHFMIHNPRATVWDSQPDQMRSQLKALEDMQAAMVSAYVKKTGLAESKVRALMDAETWYTSAEALAAGFVDEVVTTALELAAIGSALHFERFQYHNAPAHLGAINRSSPRMKTQLAAFVAQLLKKVATDATPEAALLALVAEKAGADLSIIQAVASGMLSVTPTAKHLEAFADVLQSDGELLRIEAAKDFDVFKAKPRVRPDANGQVIDMEGASNIGRLAEQKRVREIMQVFAPYAQHVALRDECITNATMTVDASMRILLDAIGKDATPLQPGGTARVIADVQDKFKTGVFQALMGRGDAAYRKAHGAELQRNEFAGLSMVELARISLRVSGQGHLANGPAIRVVGAAFGTDNFTTALEDIANKFAHQGWEEANESWRSWVDVRPMNDFKAHSFMNLSEFDDLLPVDENQEYKFGKFVDQGEKATLATFGRMFGISRQAIINDDVDVFTQIPRRMGGAAARKIGDLAYAIITVNAPMGSDGVALFHATHANLEATGGAPTTARFDAARVAMALQTGPNGKTLGIRPRFALVPEALKGAAMVVVQAENEVDTSAKNSRLPNIARNLVEVVSDHRLDTDSAVKWYFAADPALTPTVIMGFLNGQEAPFLENEQGWRTDGTEFKVRIDAVAKAIDWRGMYENDGA